MMELEYILISKIRFFRVRFSVGVYARMVELEDTPALGTGAYA